MKVGTTWHNFGLICLALLAACGKAHSADRDASLEDAGTRDAHITVDAGDNWFACQVPTDCTVVPSTCCGSCGQASPDDAISVNENFADEYRASACEGGVGCPACFGEPDPNLLSECITPDEGPNQCQFFDLRTSELARCTTDDDCVLRASGCCACVEDTPASELVSINASSSAEFERLTCGLDVDCGPCSGVAEALPICRAGVCGVGFGA